MEGRPSSITWSDGISSISAIGLALDQRQRGDAGRRRGVAADRLEQQRLRRHADLAQLLGDDKAVLLIGDDQRAAKARRAGDAQRRLLQQAVMAEQAAEAALDKACATSATAVSPTRPTKSPDEIVSISPRHRMYQPRSRSAAPGHRPSDRHAIPQRGGV